jgi:hypothetical protein
MRAGSAVRPVCVDPDVQAYPLEQISVPTLINAKDDGLSASTTPLGPLDGSHNQS